MTKTLLSNDILMAYNQLLANISKPMIVNNPTNNYNSCNQCGATFTDPKSLAKHELSHTQNKRKHECKECGKRFNSSSDLKRHSLIHTNTRPYKCHLCPTAFVQQAHLTRHLKSHTRHGVRFKCLGCGTMFLHSTNVRWHQQFCEEARGSNGGYVVTQSEGEGLDSVNAAAPKPTKPTTPDNKLNNSWTRENKIYYFDGPFPVSGGGSRHSSSSDNEISTSSTDSSEGGGTASLLNSSKLIYFDGPYDKSELLRGTKPKYEQQSCVKPLANHLSASQLSYLNSRVSMVAPQPLKNIPPLLAKSPTDHIPQTTEDILKLLATFQDGKPTALPNKPPLNTLPPGNHGNTLPPLNNNGPVSQTQPTSNHGNTQPTSTYQTPGNHGNTQPTIKTEPRSSSPSDQKANDTAFSQLNQDTINLQSQFLPQRQLFSSSTSSTGGGAQPLSPRSPTYKIVPNKIIQHNVTSPSSSSSSHQDKIKPILELVKKLVAEGLQSPTAEVILNAISRHLGNMTPSSPLYYPTFTSTSSNCNHGNTPQQPCNKKRKLSEPSQALLNNNLLAAQNILANNIAPLLKAPSTAPPLSFTPLLFRQFPALSAQLPALSAQLPGLVSSANQLFNNNSNQLFSNNSNQLFSNSTQGPGMLNNTPPPALNFKPSANINFKPSATTNFATQLLQLTTAKLSPPQPITAQYTGHVTSPQPITAQYTGHVTTAKLSPTSTVSEPGPATLDRKSPAIARDAAPPMAEESEESRDVEEPMGGLEDDKTAGQDQLDKNVETSKNIAFHRLKDLLSLV